MLHMGYRYNRRRVVRSSPRGGGHGLPATLPRLVRRADDIFLYARSVGVARTADWGWVWVREVCCSKKNYKKTYMHPN
jgi:hypothetical protein